MTRLRSLRRFAPFLLIFVLLTACGDSTDGAEPTLAPTTTEAAATTTTTAPPDGDGSAVVIGRSTGTIQSAGLEREHVLYVPAGYDDEVPLPLVIAFHGYTMNADWQAEDSGLPAFGDGKGFITVFPEGRGNVQRWLFELDSAEIDTSGANPDIALVDDLIDQLSEQLAVDPDRIYAVGFSNGGWMVSAAACTLSDRFAAVAQVAGIMDFGDDCVPADPVPLVTFHGTADEYEPFDGGVGARGDLPTDLGRPLANLPVMENPIFELSVPDKVELWAARNGCEGEPTAASDAQVTQREYTCPDADPVVFYEIESGTHWWDITTGFNTNEYLWDFFSSQSR